VQASRIRIRSRLVTAAAEQARVSRRAGTTESSQSYQFLHATVHEFLAARGFLRFRPALDQTLRTGSLRQCLLTLLVRQPAPKLLEHQRDRRARGGITVVAARDMGLLLESRIGEFASTATTRVSRKGRLWASSTNCVRAEQWGHSFSCFYVDARCLAMTPSWPWANAAAYSAVPVPTIPAEKITSGSSRHSTISSSRSRRRTSCS
jgi:hypothetical protein